MPNWTDSHLAILLPRVNLEALKADLSGPCMWSYPLSDTNSDGIGQAIETLSNHQRLEIDANAPELIARFKALEANKERPDWMPVSRMDVAAMLLKHELLGAELKQVPFSIPKLHPWEDRQEFDRFFPGQMNGPYWNVAQEKLRSYNSGRLGSIALSRQRIGCKWPPQEVRIARENTIDGADTVDLHIRYMTPNAPISNFTSLVEKVLAKHGAKALVIWDDEDGTTGFDYVNPAEDHEISDEFGEELVLEGEDDDGDPLCGINREKLIECAISGAGDDDFVGVF